MAENVTIARPYAEAAFKVALAGNALASWADALAAMAAVAADPDMKACADNPRLLPKDLAQFYINILGGNISAEQQNFAQILVDNDRLDVLNEVCSLFVDMKNAHEGTKEANISSAFPLDADTLKTLVVDLERRFACKIQATVEVDPELIGGVRIAVGDQVIDASVRGKLAAMSVALQN